MGYNCLKIKTLRLLFEALLLNRVCFSYISDKSDVFSLCVTQPALYSILLCFALSSSSLQSQCLLVCSFILCPVVLRTVRPIVLSSLAFSTESLHLGSISSLQQRPCEGEHCVVIVSFINTVLMFWGIKKKLAIKIILESRIACLSVEASAFMGTLPL